MAILNLGVVILGAGASSRMGRPKLLLPWQDATVIGHILSQWGQLGAAQIAVVTRRGDAAIEEELVRCDVSKADCIVNPQPERGMFSSIICAANWNGWTREISHVAIVLGDQPHLKRETLQKLLSLAAQNQAAICQPACGGKAKHPVILPRTVFAALKTTKAETLKMFLKLADAPHVLCSVDDAGLSFDLDTPEDYKRLSPI